VAMFAPTTLLDPGGVCGSCALEKISA
jgi:hypothetical protein